MRSVERGRREQEADREPVVARPRPAPSLTPGGVLALQRTAGNQAVARQLLQRAPVAPNTYLTNLIASDSGDPEWDPQWTVALGRVAGGANLAQFFKPLMDDADEGDVAKLLGVMKGLAELSSDKPNMTKIAMDAVRWHAGIESDSGGSGFGSLDTSTQPFTGRPAFPAITQANVPLRAGQHRRHILPWHSIREFVSIAYAAQREPVITTIWKLFNAPPDEAVAQAFAEATKHVVTGREKTGKGSDVLSDDELLRMGLFVMNGNPRNLWAGKGSTNSAINTAQMHMHTALSKLNTFQDVAKLASDWQNASGKAVYKSATELGANVLTQEGTMAYSLWEVTKDPMQEKSAVDGVAAKVKDYVVSNLEIDVLGDSKAQTEIAQEKQGALKESVMFIDNVVTGKAQVGELPGRFISEAIAEFLTYYK